MSGFRISAIFLCVLHLSYSDDSKNVLTYKGFKIFEVEGDKNVLESFVKQASEEFILPFYEFNGAKASIMISPNTVDSFKEMAQKYNLFVSLTVEDVSKLIEKEKTSTRGTNTFSWTAYYDIDDIYWYLNNASSAHPEWTEVIVGGETYEGRQIQGVRINTPGNADKPVIFIESGIHAREWITPATTTYFINELLTNSDPEVVGLREQFDWRIFPVVNPDGYHYSFKRDRMWRKTRSKSSLTCYGADANRNWDYNWLKHGATNRPCDYQTFGGSKPFSEVETRTLSQYISGIENLLGYIAFHSYAQALLLPYSDSTEHVDNYDDLLQIGNFSLEYGRAVNGEQYGGPDTAANILYKASGGSMDWVRYALGTRLVFTYELRGYYFHWPSSRIHEQGEEVTQMMIGLFKEAQNLGYF